MFDNVPLPGTVSATRSYLRSSIAWGQLEARFIKPHSQALRGYLSLQGRKGMLKVININIIEALIVGPV